MPAVCTHAVPAPAALAPVRCPVWIARLPCVAVVRPMFGVAAQAAPFARAPWILHSASDGKSCAGAGQFHGRVYGQSFLPALSRYALRCPSGRAALHCHSVLSQTSEPSGAE